MIAKNEQGNEGSPAEDANEILRRIRQRRQAMRQADHLQVAPDDDDDEEPDNDQKVAPQAMPRQQKEPRARIPDPPQRREEPHQMKKQPPPQPPPSMTIEPPQASMAMIDRRVVARNYWIAFALFGIICEANSAYTTGVLVYWAWSLMFAPSKFSYVVAGLVLVGLIIGEIFNSDFEEVVLIEEDGEMIPVLSPIGNKRRNYGIFLLIDAGITMCFWTAPFVNLFVYIFFHAQVGASTLQDVAELLARAYASPSWAAFLAFVFLCLLPATLIASAWSVISAYVPEKAVLGPRTREKIKLGIIGQVQRIQGAVGM